MHTFSRTKLKKDLRLLLAVLAAATLLLVVFFFVMRIEPQIIDPGEMPGEPENGADIRGYVAYETPDVCRVKICCEPQLADGHASIYLTNPAGNAVLLRAELYSVKVTYDESTGQASYLPDRLLGKTGFIHPGTYVEKVKVTGLQAGKENRVLVKISTMYEESGKSNGIFYIRTTLAA